jgi:starch synthase
MRYGTPPIVRAVGGLLDTVKHWETGFMFNSMNAGGVLHGVNEFLKHPNRETVSKNAMQADFSWDRPASEYLALYRQLLGQE